MNALRRCTLQASCRPMVEKGHAHLVEACSYRLESLNATKIERTSFCSGGVDYGKETASKYLARTFDSSEDILRDGWQAFVPRELVFILGSCAPHCVINAKPKSTGGRERLHEKLHSAIALKERPDTLYAGR